MAALTPSPIKGEVGADFFLLGSGLSGLAEADVSPKATTRRLPAAPQSLSLSDIIEFPILSEMKKIQLTLICFTSFSIRSYIHLSV